MKLTKFATVQNGAVTVSGLNEWEGKRLEINLSKMYGTRSLNQNKYYWAVIIQYALKGLVDAGNEQLTPDVVHEFFKQRFLEGRNIIIPRTGEMVRVRSTTMLSKTEMMLYVDSIIKFCAEFLNTVIPLPNDV